QRVDEPLADEAVAHEHPREGRPGDRVHEGDDERRDERELDRRDGLPAGDRGPEAVTALRSRPPQQGGEREEDDQAQVERGETLHEGPAAGARAGRGERYGSTCQGPLRSSTRSRSWGRRTASAPSPSRRIS